MATLRLPPETTAFLEGMALDIFTDAVNAGLPFQHALMAVYLSGMDHARGAAAENAAALAATAS